MLNAQHGIQQQSDSADYGMYNNLTALTGSARNTNKQPSFFILPEFQKIQHTFRKLNPNLLHYLNDENLQESARYLELNYR